MKTRCWVGLFAAMSIASAFRMGAADNEEPTPAITPPNDTATAKPAVPTSSSAVVVQPATNTAPASVVPWKLGLPPVLDQVVRLSQSGTDEAVVRAYVEKAASPYQMTGNDIVQLQDLGVSKGVILALIEHSKTAPPVAGDVAPAMQVQVSAPQTSSPSPMTDAPAPPETDAASDYYGALAPYGTWADVPGYGWCWQPTVVVVNPDWRPYWDNGYWAWSDCGWYWNSSYSWGWAPFHYGRWFSHGSSWYWCPDRVWGPSWVCWRNTPTHCGWAPLPPGACFTAGVGWTHHGVAVDAGFGFGIASVNFNFVSHDHFTDHHVSHHGLHGHDANTAYAHSSVVNNYRMSGNGRVFNEGVGREQIAAARGAPIQTVSAGELTRRGQSLSARASAMAQNGRVSVNNANGVQASRNTVAMASRSTGQFSPGNRGPQSAAQQTGPNYPAVAQSHGQQPSPRNMQQTPAFRNNYAAASARANTMPRVNTVPRFSAQQPFQPRYGGGGAGVGRTSVARRSFAPQASASRQFAPQSFGARSSFQGRSSSFAGSVSRGSSASVGRSFAGRQ